MASVDDLSCCGLGQIIANNYDTQKSITGAINGDIKCTSETPENDCDNDCPDDCEDCEDCPKYESSISPDEYGRKRAYFCITRYDEHKLAMTLKKMGFKSIAVFPRRLCCGEGNLTMWFKTYPIKKD